MRVKLKFPAYVKGQFFPAGVNENWPDDAKLPSSAVETTEALPEPEKAEVPIALSELQAKTTGPKKVRV